MLSSIVLCSNLLVANISTSATSNITPIKTSVKYYSVKKGDTYFSLFNKARLPKKNISQFITALKSHKNFKLKPNHLYSVEISKKQKINSLKVYNTENDQVLVFESVDNQASVYTEEINYKVKIKNIKGKVVGSLVNAINSQSKDRILAYRFLDAFALDFNIRKQIQRNAPFALTFEEKFIGNHFVKTDEVLKAELEINKKNIKRTYVENDFGGSFIDPEENFTNRPFYLPLPKMRITSFYQRRRKHPVSGRRIAHLGIDFEAPTGTPIFSPLEGEIIKFGKTRGAGRYVVIKHKNNFKSYYNHLNLYDPNLKKGMMVKTGTYIGDVGCTGYCTKPHLHFALKKNNKFINPIKHIKPHPFIIKKLVERERKKLALVL